MKHAIGQVINEEFTEIRGYLDPMPNAIQLGSLLFISPMVIPLWILGMIGKIAFTAARHMYASYKSC